MIFVYKAYDRREKVKRGEIEAENRSEALEMLKEQNLRPFKLEEKQPPLLERIKKFIKDDPFFIRASLGRRKRKKQLDSLKEELTFMGYDEESIKDLLKGYNEYNFDVKKFSEEVIELSILQLEKVEAGRIRANEKPTKDGKVKDRESKKRRVSKDELVMFSEQLGILLDTDVELIDALATVQKNMNNKRFSAVVDILLYDLTKGREFSEALAQHPEVFGNFYISMIKVGESTGSELSSALSDLVRFLKMQTRLKKEFQKAMIYPSFVVIAVIALMIFLNYFIIPKMQEVFTSMDFEMPGLTKIIFAISENFPIFLAIFGVSILTLVIVIWKVSFFREKVKHFIDWFTLKVPIIKDAIMTTLMYQLTLTMSITLRNGVYLTETLELVNGVIWNRYLKREIEEVYLELERGVDISEAFESKQYVTHIVKTAMASGEKSGKLGETIDKVAIYYESELEQKLETLVAFITPVSILVIAAFVGPFIVGVYLPIASLTEQMGSMR